MATSRQRLYTLSEAHLRIIVRAWAEGEGTAISECAPRIAEESRKLRARIEAFLHCIGALPDLADLLDVAWDPADDCYVEDDADDVDEAERFRRMKARSMAQEEADRAAIVEWVRGLGRG